jgi:predicted phosphodiesterase
MRYGVLADIHANAQALEAVTSRLRRIGVDRYLCAGDLVGYGPQPNECVEMTASLEPICVAGNHDLMALGQLSDEHGTMLARLCMHWTREVLSDDARAYLASLPRRADAEGGVVVAHGALDDPEEYVRRADQASIQLGRLGRQHPGARLLVVGHTHLAFASDGRSAAPEPAATGALALDSAPTWLLNPGAVGQSHAIPYDVEGCRRMLRKAGLPDRSYHLRPTRWKAWSRPLHRALLRVRILRTAAGRRQR